MIWQRYFTPVDSDGMAKIHINYQSKWLFQLYRLHQFFIATRGRSQCIHELARLTKFYIFSKQITVLLVQYGPLITQICISRVPIWHNWVMAPKIREANCGSRSWNRLPCVLFSCEKVSPRRDFTVAGRHLFGNTMEAEAQLPAVLPFSCHCHLPLIGIIWHRDHQSTAKKV